jgi:opacity protein-like surface antigen
MKAYWKVAALTAAASFQATAAHAQEGEAKGFYGGLNVGVAGINDVDVTYYDAGGTFGGTGPQDTFGGTFGEKSAATFGGTLGYDFGMLRTDLEISYARNRINSFTVVNVNGAPITLTPADRQDVCDYLELDTCGGSGNTFAIDGGGLRQLNGMANLWFDLPVGGGLVPYAGGGVGISGLEVDGEGKARFAWQLGAGAAFHLNPRLAVTADFRHREASSTTVEYDAASGLRISKLRTNSLTLGLRAYF